MQQMVYTVCHLSKTRVTKVQALLDAAFSMRFWSTLFAMPYFWESHSGAQEPIICLIVLKME